MGNNNVADIVGIGDICIQTNVGCTVILKNVRHIPDLCLNLISMSALDKEGYKHQLGEGIWKLSKGSLLVAKGEICCMLYKTRVKVCGGQINAVEDNASPNLWHRKLAHMISEKGLKILAKDSLISLSKVKTLNPCDYCLFGKHHRVSFAST